MTMFVVTITHRSGGKGKLRALRSGLATSLQRLIVCELPSVLAGRSGNMIPGLGKDALEVRTQMIQMGGERAPDFDIALRHHETAVPHPGLAAYTDRLTWAFVQYCGNAAHVLRAQCVAAEVQTVNITTWLPSSSGVEMDVVSGSFVRAWSGFFRKGGALSFRDPV